MNTILVIEDDAYLREEIVDTLRFEGFNVVEADNGRSGVMLAQKHIPNVIISDIMMPDLDGYGVLKAVRENASTLHIPVIFLTAKSTELDIRYGKQLGADAYLLKPFDTEELVQKIQSYLDE